MTKKSSHFHKNNVTLIILSFLLGAITTYLLVTSTSYIPINYEKKFEQIYDSQVRERGWQTYVDLVKGITFNYPDYFFIRTSYDHTTSRDESHGWSAILDRNGNSFNVPLYDSTISISTGKSKYSYKFATLMDFAKDYLEFYESSTTFQKKDINGKEAIVADFIVSEEFYKKLKALSRSDIVDPIGLKRKTIFIKKNNSVYIIKSGSLFSETEAERFDKIVNSIKFFN